jgi:hypothetical protein
MAQNGFICKVIFHDSWQQQQQQQQLFSPLENSSSWLANADHYSVCVLVEAHLAWAFAWSKLAFGLMCTLPFIVCLMAIVNALYLLALKYAGLVLVRLIRIIIV